MRLNEQNQISFITVSAVIGLRIDHALRVLCVVYGQASPLSMNGSQLHDICLRCPSLEFANLHGTSAERVAHLDTRALRGALGAPPPGTADRRATAMEWSA